MRITFEQAKNVASQLAPFFREFSWFQGIGIEKENDRIFLSIRVAPPTSCDDARSMSEGLWTDQDIEILFKEQAPIQTLRDLRRAG
jgi:hypothetical protein